MQRLLLKRRPDFRQDELPIHHPEWRHIVMKSHSLTIGGKLPAAAAAMPS